MLHAFSPTAHSGPGRTLVLRSQVGLTGPDPQTRTGWAHISRCGEWLGHPSGPFEITTAHLEAIVEAFNAAANPVVMDYEHASTSGEKAPAAGWIQQLEVRNGTDLWALIEWTEEGAAHVRKGEYRFASAVLFFNRPLRESGEPWLCRLHSCAATNAPFIDGLTAIALSERVAPTRTHGAGPVVALAERRPVINKKVIADAIKAAPSDQMTEEQWTAWIAAWLGAAGANAPAAAPPKDVASSDAPRPKSIALADSAKALLAQIAGLLKVDVNDADDLFNTVYDALRALQSAAQVESMLSAAPALSDDVKRLARAMRALADSTTAGAPAPKEREMADDGMPPGTSGSGETPAADAKAMIAARLLEASGMDETALAAAIEANLAAVVAALTGTPPVASSDPAMTAQLSETKRQLATAQSKLAALEPTVRSLSEKLATREKAEAEVALAKRTAVVDTLIKSGQVPESARGAYVALSDSAFSDITAGFRVDLSEVPFGSELGGARQPTQTSGELNEKDPRVVQLREAFARSGLALSERGPNGVDPTGRMTPEQRTAAIAARKQIQDEKIRAELGLRKGA